VAKSLADELHARLANLALACTRLLVVAETEHGERHERLWRDEGALTAGAVADRVRWQLDGWINGTAASNRPTAGITTLKLVPDEVAPARGRQLGFWGGTAEAGERAARALARVEALLGPGAAAVPERRGGRAPSEQVAMVPASAVDLVSARPSAGAGWVTEPWPGQMPTPSPAVVYREPVPADIVDRTGGSVGVSGRGVATAAPAHVTVDGNAWGEVSAWAGPWPADERWWDPAGHRRRARVQVVAKDGRAGLFVLEAGRWWLEATYD
jgi:protein ImuB